MRRDSARSKVMEGLRHVGKVLTWGGLLLGVVGIAGFFYGLVVLIGNGNCGCDTNGFCSGPPCPPADNLGFVGLFAGIWVAVIGFIMAGVGRGRGRAQRWRDQLATSTGGAGAPAGSRGIVPLVVEPGAGVTFASMSGGSIGPGGGMGAGGQPAAGSMGDTGPSLMSGPAPLTAEAILAREAQSGLPTMASQPMDAAARLQELEALKDRGVLTDEEYATQRKRILDSI